MVADGAVLGGDEEARGGRADGDAERDLEAPLRAEALVVGERRRRED